MTRRARNRLQGVMWDADPDTNRPTSRPPEDRDLRVRREVREARVKYYEGFGVRPPTEDPTCCFVMACTCSECKDRKRAEAEVKAILAERGEQVKQGWTWIRGHKERIADLVAEGALPDQGVARQRPGIALTRRA